MDHRTPALQVSIPRRDAQLCPVGVAFLAGPFGADRTFLNTVAAIDVVLAGIDVAAPVKDRAVVGRGPTVRLLWAELRPFADRPIRDAIEHLLALVDPVAADIAGDLVSTDNKIITVPTLDNPVVTDAFRRPALEGNLFTLHEHLFLPDRNWQLRLPSATPRRAK